MPKWRLYGCSGRYRIGSPKKFIWWNYIEWYTTNVIQNPEYHTETRYGHPVEFETKHLEYAKRELARLNELEASIEAERLARKPRTIWSEVKDA